MRHTSRRQSLPQLLLLIVLPAGKIWKIDAGIKGVPIHRWPARHRPAA